VEVSPEKYGQFYGGDSYILLYTYYDKRGKEAYIIYFWQARGEGISFPFFSIFFPCARALCALFEALLIVPLGSRLVQGRDWRQRVAREGVG
jgi:hypothetical protein